MHICVSIKLVLLFVVQAQIRLKFLVKSSARNNDFSINTRSLTHTHTRYIAYDTRANAIIIICMLHLYANVSILWMNYDYLFKFGTFLLHDIFVGCMENSRKNKANRKLRERKKKIYTQKQQRNCAKLRMENFDIPKIATQIQIQMHFKSKAK